MYRDIHYDISDEADGHFSVGHNEDAERVTVKIGVYAKRLVRVIGPVVEHLGTKTQRAAMYCLQRIEASDRDVQVQLLGHAARWPGRRRQFVHLLERQARRPIGVAEVEPVTSGSIVLTRHRRLMALPVDQPEQLPPELGAATCVRRVEDDLTDPRYEPVLHDSRMTLQPAVSEQPLPERNGKHVRLAPSPVPFGGRIGQDGSGVHRGSGRQPAGGSGQPGGALNLTDTGGVDRRAMSTIPITRHGIQRTEQRIDA
jgi:hypothetical protein